MPFFVFKLGLFGYNVLFEVYSLFISLLTKTKCQIKPNNCLWNTEYFSVP